MSYRQYRNIGSTASFLLKFTIHLYIRRKQFPRFNGLLFFNIDGHPPWTVLGESVHPSIRLTKIFPHHNDGIVEGERWLIDKGSSHLTGFVGSRFSAGKVSVTEMTSVGER